MEPQCVLLLLLVVRVTIHMNFIYYITTLVGLSIYWTLITVYLRLLCALSAIIFFLIFYMCFMFFGFTGQYFIYTRSTGVNISAFYHSLFIDFTYLFTECVIGYILFTFPALSQRRHQPFSILYMFCFKLDSQVFCNSAP